MRKSPQFVARTISSQMLLLPLLPGDEGRWVYELNETAAFLWSHMEGDFTEAQLTESLRAEFELSADEAERDVSALVADLRSFGAIA